MIGSPGGSGGTPVDLGRVCGVLRGLGGLGENLRSQRVWGTLRDLRGFWGVWGHCGGWEHSVVGSEVTGGWSWRGWGEWGGVSTQVIWGGTGGVLGGPRETLSPWGGRGSPLPPSTPGGVRGPPLWHCTWGGLGDLPKGRRPGGIPEVGAGLGGAMLTTPLTL